MRRSMFTHGLAGTGTALVATLLFAGFASADTAAPLPQPPQTSSPVVATSTSNQVIKSDSTAVTKVVSKSDVVVAAPLKSNQAGSDSSASTSAPVAISDNNQLAPVTPISPKVNDGLLTSGTPPLKTDASAPVASTPAAVTGQEVPALPASVSVSAKIAASYVPERTRTVSQASFSEQRSGLTAVTVVAPEVQADTAVPGQPPVKSTGVLTQLSELMRNLFAPLVAGASGLAALASSSSWPLLNFYVLVAASFVGITGFASYLSRLRRSGYNHGARSDEDGRQLASPLLMGFSAVAVSGTLGGPFLVGFVQNPDSFKCSLTPIRKEVKK